ncbi:DUF362 domain-containing protein [Alkalibaculum bacchi]|uniref:DUF362 domain-containing protein n=1 Tax=Alkalibaculum bacchi TaxID=645887 RepID=UPI0026EFCB40|nr:DUF362 domain-containing protein [Alkalibaculum bacchi]
MKEKIALLKCTGYELELVERTLREGFELLGGEPFIRKLIPLNAKVLLKPNLLMAEEAGSPVITHYIVFEALLRIISDYTDSITFGDSPGFGSSYKAAQKARLIEVGSKYGASFVDFNDNINLELEDAILCKNWDIARAAYESDVLISLPKLKTHGMMYYTGAVKNQFGCVPGTRKAVWHARMNNLENFAKMLLDLNTLVDTKFAVLDGIVAMEGNGPRNGTPRKMDTIIMGESLTAIDAVAASLIGYEDPLELPQLKAAYESNWGTVFLDEIKILGEKREGLKVEDFKLIAKKLEYLGTEGSHKFMRRFLAPYPKLILEKCISCNRCYEVCPEKPDVITMTDQKGKKAPEFNKKTCIRCFCCQELCPEGAIEVAQTRLGRVFN